MTLTPLDWAVIAAYFLFNLGIGFYYKSRAGSSTGEFFLSGRNVPWWLAGWNLADWLAGCALVYGALFGIGKVILQDYAAGVVFLAIAVAAASFIYWDLNRRGWASLME